MKTNNSIINIIYGIILITVIGLPFLINKQYSNAQSLIYYYDSIRDMKLVRIYTYKYLFNAFYLLPMYVTIIFVYEIKEKIIIDKQFYDYPYIRDEYSGFYYFNLCGLILLILGSIIMITQMTYVPMFQYLDMTFILSTVLFFFPLMLNPWRNYLYHNVKAKIKTIRKSKFEIKEEFNENFIVYKSKTLFFILLLILIFPLIYTINKFEIANQYNNYPSQLTLTENSTFDQNFKTCYLTDSIHCYHMDILENYKLTSITLNVTSESFIELLSSTDYVIEISYSGQIYPLTSDDYILDKTNDDYTFLINFTNYLAKNNLPEENFTSFYLQIENDEQKKIIDSQSIAHYTITLEKLTGDEVIVEYVNPFESLFN